VRNSKKRKELSRNAGIKALQDFLIFATMSDNNYLVKVRSSEYAVEINGEKSALVNKEQLTWDLVREKKGSFHVILGNKSYRVDVVKADKKEKSFVILVNGIKHTLDVKDKFDMLLKSMGLDNMASHKVNNMKAPMPGLVLDIKVGAGDVIKKGDAVVVLEAMKMENNLKSPGDGTIKKINVQKGQAVEKNQVLVEFE
jgi:biotin carboxyl carrier protein